MHELNSTMLVMAYSGIFGASGPAIRFLALTMDRNATGIRSQTLLSTNFTGAVENITSGLHMVYDQGDVALIYQDSSRMCLQVVGLRPPPSGGNQPPPPPGAVPPPQFGGEASFAHISTISYPTTQRPYFSVVYARDVHVGTINGTCLHHMLTGFDGIKNTSLLFCPISPDSPMDPLAEIWYHPNNLDSFFVISKAGTGVSFEVRRCTGVSSGSIFCTGLLTGGNGIPVQPGVDMVASKSNQNGKFWFGWRVNGVVSVICLTFNETSVSKVSNVYLTSLAADSFSFVDSLNPDGISLIIRYGTTVERQDLAWPSSGNDIQVDQSWQAVTNLEDATGSLISTESLGGSIFALVSTAGGSSVSLNYFAVPYCGNTLVSPGTEECELPMDNCNSTCQCVSGVDPQGGCFALQTPTALVPASTPSADSTIGPSSQLSSNDKLVQTVVPSVVIPVVVVAVGVAVLVILLKRRKKAKKVKDDKIRLEPANVSFSFVHEKESLQRLIYDVLLVPSYARG